MVRYRDGLTRWFIAERCRISCRADAARPVHAALYRAVNALGMLIVMVAAGVYGEADEPDHLVDHDAGHRERITVGIQRDAEPWLQSYQHLHGYELRHFTPRSRPLQPARELVSSPA